MITDINQLDFNKKYTYADYLTWQFQERVELLKGRVFEMSPAPNRRHQQLSWKLTLKIGNFLDQKKCEAYSAPFDVRLPLPEHKVKKDKIETVVQPDICVICDEYKLDEQGCVGAPDLVVEILSAGNSRRELKDKFELYENAGVLEYWIVEPYKEYITVYLLNEDGAFVGSKPLLDGMFLKSTVLEGFELDVSKFFEE
ncbi:MAG: Uma2 family endonuclease [Saprospiraceae bacterium]|nr:Uma2 family endonuclease [Saprospiraceae bacterium]